MTKYIYIFLSGVLIYLPLENIKNNVDQRALSEFKDSSAREMIFIKMPPGKFMMDSKTGEKNERPVHEVLVTEHFEIQETEVTQYQWQKIMGTDPGSFKGVNRPVETVSWNDAQLFIEKMNQLKDGYHYRLPTEIEWEYSCRAGSLDELAGASDEMCYHNDNSGLTSHPVGSRKPNAWGIYDMNGNVWEFVQDSYHLYNQKKAGRKPPEENWKLMRGGGWHTLKQNCRSTIRLVENPDFKNSALGFRLVRTYKQAN